MNLITKNIGDKFGCLTLIEKIRVSDKRAKGIFKCTCGKIITKNLYVKNLSVDYCSYRCENNKKDTKICSSCKNEYPLNKEYFYKRHTSFDGYDNVCKKCKTIVKKRKYEHISDDKLLCIKCFEYKNDEEFDISPEKIYRRKRDSRCKECKKKQTIKRRLNNRGKKDLDRMLLERWHGIKIRCKKHNKINDITLNDLKELYIKQNGKCAISNIQMTFIMMNGRTNTNISIDKIDCHKDYTKDNIQLVCMAVNQMKSDMDLNELIYFCKQIINNNESNN